MTIRSLVRLAVLTTHSSGEMPVVPSGSFGALLETLIDVSRRAASN